jgi:hypothetical protein
MNLHYLLPRFGMDYIHSRCHIARIDILVMMQEVVDRCKRE